jgi:hypothetical protein
MFGIPFSSILRGPGGQGANPQAGADPRQREARPAARTTAGRGPEEGPGEGAQRGGGRRQSREDTQMQVPLHGTFATTHPREPGTTRRYANRRQSGALQRGRSDRERRRRDALGAIVGQHLRRVLVQLVARSDKSRRFRETEPATVCPSGVACRVLPLAVLSVVSASLWVGFVWALRAPAGCRPRGAVDGAVRLAVGGARRASRFVH